MRLIPIPSVGGGRPDADAADGEGLEVATDAAVSLSARRNFVFLSQILGRPLVDRSSKARLGTITDLATELRDSYPKITGLMARKGRAPAFYVPWTSVRQLGESESCIYVEDAQARAAAPAGDRPSEILLKQTFFDRQIINVSGAKVVRVNDLHLLKENNNLWLVHFDVGFAGILRRLRWLRLAEALSARLRNREVAEKLIPWRCAQPIKATTVQGSIYLKIPFSRLADAHPADIAEVIADLGIDDRMAVFQSLDKLLAARTLQAVPLAIRTQIAEDLDPGRLAAVVGNMAMDEVADLLDKLSPERTSALYAMLPVAKVSEIKELLTHAEHTAGSLMNTDFVAVREDDLVKDALRLISSKHERFESIYYLYVVDSEGALVGVVSLRDLLTSAPALRIEGIMQDNIVKVQVDTHLKDVSQVFYRYDFNVIPVVDEANRMKGIITMKDAFEAVFPEIRREAEGK
jgi:magnesium transporter